MSLKRLVRLMPVGWTGGTRALVDLLAARRAFEATEVQKEEIARRADAFLASRHRGADAERELKFDALVSDWKTRADAAARLDADGAWTPWETVGSLADAPEGERAPAPVDDALRAAAVLIAAREILVRDHAAMHERLRGPASAALAHEKGGAGVWDAAASPLVAAFVRNARVLGADRRTAALRALAAAAHLKGRAMRAPARGEAFRLGAAAAALLRRKPMKKRADALRLEALAAALSELNGARAALWEGLDAETARRMGAAAAVASFGRGTIAPPHRGVSVRRRAAPVFRLADAPERLAHLTAADAAAKLAAEASDPRLDAPRRRRLEALSDMLLHHPSAYAASCAEALGLEPPEPRSAGLEPGMTLYRAAPEGRRRPMICEGRNGRPVRCRPVASADGALVGHLAFDALSREFGGRPLYAVYALDGSRYGYAWADARPIVRRGEPEQGFMTAPVRIPV